MYGVFLSSHTCFYGENAIALEKPSTKKHILNVILHGFRLKKKFVYGVRVSFHTCFYGEKRDFGPRCCRKTSFIRKFTCKSQSRLAASPREPFCAFLKAFLGG